MKDIENSKKESPMLGLTGLGGGATSLMWASSGTQKFDMYAWGLQTSQIPSTHPNQYYGYLGLNQAFGYKDSPVQVPGDWYKMWTGGITGNYGNTVGGSKDEPGTLWMWGGNDGGNLGQNQGPPSNDNKRSSPTQVGTETNWENVSISRFTLGSKDDGSMWAWGINQYGELGHNNKTDYSSPKQLGYDLTWSGDPFTLVSSAPNAGQHAFAIKTDGTLWSWGSQTGGSLGHNEGNQDYSSPKQIGTDTTWKHLAAGSSTAAFAIKTDGTLWGWGWNNGGAMGQNDRNQRSSPVQIPGTWKQAATGSRTWGTYGIKTDGTLWSWGYNTEGVLGLGYEPAALGGTWRGRSSPCQVGTRTDWGLIDAGGGDGSMVKGITTDGKIFLWGNNYGGYSLGFGPAFSATRVSSPTQVANISTKWGTGSAYDEDYAWSVASTKAANFCLRQQ
jgi:hypothetical protein